MGKSVSNYELDKSNKDNAHLIVILVIRHVSQYKSIIIMWKRDKVDDVDMYERPFTLRPLTFMCYDNVRRKSIR